MGGCNSLDKVAGNRIGNDINKYLISFLKELQKENFSFPFVGEEEYIKIKNNKNQYPDWLVGYVGFQLSFGAKWFAGYRRDKKGIRNYQKEAHQNIKIQRPLLRNVVFYHGNYWEFPIPEYSIIYCDPPYARATKYRDNFNHDFFWNWCEKMKSKGHSVFVSEYSAPKNWKCVWEKT